MAHAWNKLHLGVQCLTQAGSQRERLTAAIAQHLVCIRPKDLPAACRAEFAAVIDRLCLDRVQALDASVKRMVDAIDDREVSRMIDAILGLYDALARYQPIPAPVVS